MKKKLVFLAVACTILIILGGINTTLLYGTQYMTSKPHYSFTVSSAVEWWDCNWSYCKKITIDHTKVQENQTDYPVLIYESADAELAAYAQSDGDDIAFVDLYNSTQYKHEIEEYNSSTGELTAWVKISSLSSTSDTILYMYYGNPTCSNQQNITGTWDSSFKMVQHLNESSGILVDSTSNYNNGTNNGAAYNASSKIDGGYDFDGSDNITVSDDSSLDITSSITLEGWVKDPPWLKNKDETIVRIIDKREEERLIIPGKQFIVERTIYVNKKTELIFVALFSPGIKLKDMSIGDISILKSTYVAYKANSDYENHIEDIRTRLPDKLKDLEIIAYSKPFIINGKEKIKMIFESEGYNLLNNGRISYLVLSSDGNYDFESTTYWNDSYNPTNWNNPFSIYRFILGWLRNKLLDCNVVSASQAKNLIDSNENTIIIDIRSGNDYNSNHINGSISIPSLDVGCNSCLQNMLAGYKDNSIIIYGKNDLEIRKAFDILLGFGFLDIYTLNEGIETCRIAGFSIIASDDESKISIQTKIDKSLEKDKPAFLYFYINGCDYCQKEEKILVNLKEKYADEIEFVYVHKNDYPAMVESFGVTGYPTMFLVSGKNERGYIYKDFKGFTSKDTLIGVFDQALDNLGDFSVFKDWWHGEDIYFHPLPYEPNVVSKGSVTDFNRFWHNFQDHAQWSLWYNQDGNWVDVSYALDVGRRYTASNIEKLTLNFTAPFSGDYKLKLVIDNVLEYNYDEVNHAYSLRYLDYAGKELFVDYDFSDIAGLPNLIFEHYVDDDGHFVFNVSKKNVPQWVVVSLDPCYVVRLGSGFTTATDYNQQRKLARTNDRYLHTVYYMWIGELPNNAQIFYAKSDDEDGKTWTETQITEGGYDQTHPAIATDGGDRIHVVWNGTGNEIPSHIWYSYYEDEWSEIVDITEHAETEQCCPAIAVDGENNLHVVWYGSDGSNWQIYYKKCTEGSWDEEATLISEGLDGSDQMHPSIAIDSENRIYVVWHGYIDKIWQICYNIYEGVWSGPGIVTEGQEQDQMFPCVATDSSDVAHVVWHGYDGSVNQIRYNYYDGSWSEIQDLTNDANGRQYPSIAVSSEGDFLHVVYYGLEAEGEPMDYDIFYLLWAEEWASEEAITSDDFAHQIYPNIIWARYPDDGYSKPNVPDAGFALVYFNDTTNVIMYYASEDLDWPNTPPTVSSFNVDADYNLWDWDNNDAQVDWVVSDPTSDSLTLLFTYKFGSSPSNPSTSNYDAVVTGVSSGSYNNYDLNWRTNGKSDNHASGTSASNWADTTDDIYMKVIAWDGEDYSNVVEDTTNRLTGIDGTAPTSSVDTIIPYIRTTGTLELTATASDATSGLKNVTLYYYNSTNNITFTGPWNFETDNDPWVSCGWTFNFPNGTGYYEFYSIAIDNATNTETAPINNDTRCYYRGNTAPTISDPYPANQSTGQSTTPQMNITINDLDGDSMTLTWYSNSSGSWQIFGTNTSCSNGTYHQTNNNFSNYSITYYWNVSVNDGTDTNNSDIYHFTTEPINTSVDTISPYEVTASTVSLTASAEHDDYGNVTLWYRYSTDNSSWANDTNWWNPYWTYRKKLTIDHNQVAATLTNFPILVSITDTDLSSAAQSDGDDIVFTNATGTKLNHEIESYTSGTGALVAWVNVTSLSGSSDTEIYMYYGNITCSSQQNPTGVWDSNFKGVWHKDDLTTSTIEDSTSNSNDGTKKGANEPIEADGQIYKAQDYDGDEYIGCGQGASLNVIGDITVSIWLKTSSSLGGHLVHKYRLTPPYNGYGLMLSDPNVRFFDGTSWRDDTTTVNDGSWHHIAFVGSGSTGQFYVDGDAKAITGFAGIPDNSGYSLTLGCHYNGDSGFLTGVMDEVRVSNTARSADWINTTYNTTNSPSTFLSTGSEESWMQWDDGSNPDEDSPWSWEFNFPNDTGYYEFYSIGKKSGSTDEAAPSSADASCYYRGNTAPTISDPYPTNQSTGQSTTPQMNITINDLDGDSMTITWYSNSSGSWVAFGTNTSCSNGTYHQTNNNFSNYSITYYWNVSVNDGTDTNNSAIYHFTTEAINTSVDAISPYEVTASSLTVTASAEHNDYSNVTLWYRYSADNETWDSNWWNSSWNYYKTITIDSNYIDNDLKNFPLLIVINSTLGAKCDNGNSIRFVSTDNTTEFYYEIEEWDNSGNSFVWVNISEHITSASDYMFLMYYNNSGASDNQSPSSVWDSNFKAVHHLNDSTTSTVIDSTSNNNDGTKTGASQPEEVDGKIGKAQFFDTLPSEEEINLPDMGTVESYPFTFEAWFNTSVLAGTIVTQQLSTVQTTRVQLYFGDSTYLRYNVRSSTEAEIGPADHADGKWYYVVGVSSASNNHKIYVNGTLFDTSTTSVTAPSVDLCKIGRRWTGTGTGFNGSIDEVRISNIDRNASWIKASFYTQNQTPGFLTFGSEQDNNWTEWDDASNPDEDSPWSWNFDFPNGTGYYEFYSIGKKSGSTDETAPSSADATCYYQGNTAPDLINCSTDKNTYNEEETVTFTAWVNDTIDDKVVLLIANSTANLDSCNYTNRGSCIANSTNVTISSQPQQITATMTASEDTTWYAKVCDQGGLCFLANWTSPTGYEDPDNKWSSETNAYDEDTGTYASSSSAPNGDTSYIILNHSAIGCNKVRFWAWDDAPAIPKIYVDVLRNGSWIALWPSGYQDYPKDQWVEKTFSSGSVTKARIRWHFAWPGPYNVRLYEFDFWRTSESGSFSLNKPPEIGIPTVDTDPVSYGYNATVNVSVWDNDTGVSEVKCNVTYPDSTWYNFTMDNTGGALYERYNTGDDTFWLIGGIKWGGQTFTIGNTGTNEDHVITSVKLLLSRGQNPGIITVSIRATADGKPTGDDLAVGTTNGNTLPTSPSYEWREISLSPHYTLLADTQYAIIARCLDGGGADVVYWRLDSSSPTYTGGTYIRSEDDDSTWDIHAGYDSMFEEYGIAAGQDFYEKEINLTDTWQLGQHNYTIWATDGTLSNTSSQYSFNVSAQCNVTVQTEKDSYGANEYVNLTDPPDTMGDNSVGDEPFDSTEWAVIERGANFVRRQNIANPNLFSWESAPQWVYNGSVWLPYIFNETANYYEVSSGRIGARIYKSGYAEFWDPQIQNVKVYEETWEVQYYDKQEWKVCDVYSPEFSVTMDGRNISITSSFATDYPNDGQRAFTVKYIFREGSPLKHEVTFTSHNTDSYEFRIVQKWAGIVGDKVKHNKGTYTITSPTTVNSSWFRFQKDDGSLSIFENQWDIYYGFDESTGEYYVLENQNLKPVEINVHAQGLKADFVFGNWTLSQNESLTIDPDTATLDDPTEDGFVEYDSTLEYYRYNTLSYIYFGGVGDFGEWMWDDRGYVEWDISSLAGATLTANPVFKYEGVYNDATDEEINPITEEQPSSGGCTDEELYGYIASGTAYVDPFDFQVGTDKSVDLGASAKSDLQSAMDASQSWFAIGFQSPADEGELNEDLTSVFYSEEKSPAPTPKPTLYVEYTPANTAPTQSNQKIWNATTKVEKTLNATSVDLYPTGFNVTINDIDGDKMNITLKTNESGSWTVVNQTSNSGLSNGTYSFTNTSWVDTNGTTYYISFNLTDGTDWCNETYNFTTKLGYIQSKIDNVGSTNCRGYLLMQIHYNDSGSWYTVESTIDETITRTINASDHLKLDTIFNGTVYTSTNLTNGTGQYRVYVAFRDKFGSVLKNDDETYMNASYTFNYTAVTVTTPTVTTNTSTGVEETNATLCGYLSSNGSADTTCGFRFGTSSGSYNENFSKGVTANLSEFSNNNGSLTSGDLYYYQAWASNSGGFANGSELKLFTKPPATTNLAESASTNTTLTYTWTEATVGSGATAWTRIQYKTGSNPTSITDGTNTYNGTDETDGTTSLTPGTHYYFSAFSWGTEGGIGNWNDTYDTMDAWANPGDPTSVSTTNGSTWINVTFTHGQNGEYTMVRRNATGSTDFPADRTSGVEVDNTTNEYANDTGLAPDITYYYSIWTYDSNGCKWCDNKITVTEKTTTEKPEITTNSPSNGSGLNASPVILNVTVNDDVGADMTVKFYGDGNLLNTNITNGNETVTYSWDCGNNIHSWYVVVNETCNTNTSDTYWFAVNYFNDSFNNTNYVSTDSQYSGAHIIINNSYVNFTQPNNNTVAGGLDGTDRTIDATMYDSTYDWGPSPRIVVVNSTHSYAFGSDATSGYVALWNTSDGGQSWSQKSSRIDLSATGHHSGAVWYDQWTTGDTGTKIHLAWTSSGSDDLVYNWFDTATETTSGSWTTVWDGTTHSCPGDGSAGICKTDDGRLWISGFMSNPLGGKVYYSDDSGSSWTEKTPGTYFDDDDDSCQLLPLPDGDTMCIYEDAVYPGNEVLRSIIYYKSNNSWGSWNEIDELSTTWSAGCNFGASMYKLTGDIYVALNNNDISLGGDIVFWKFWASNYTWASEVKLEDNAYGYDASVVVSQGNGDIYVFYNDGSAGNYDIYCQNSTDGGNTWSTRQQINTVTDNSQYTTGNLMSYYRIYASWHNEDLNDWVGTTVRTYTISGKHADATANITSVNITKPTGDSWNRFNVDINNTANSTFSILSATDNSVILSGLDGNNNDVSSVSDPKIKLWGEFNGSISMDSWNISWTTAAATTPTVTTNASTGVEETNATLRGYLSNNGSADTTCGFRYGTSSGSYSENFSKGTYPSGTEFSNNNGSLTKGQIYFYQAWANNSAGFANGSELTFLTKPNPPVTGNLTVRANSSSVIYLNWTAGTGANTTYIERNSTAVTTWDRGEGTMIYNGSGTNYEDTGLTAGTTYYYQAWSFANWTYNPTLNQWSDENESGSNTTKNKPELSNESPSNESTGISLNPTLEIQVNHSDGYQMDINWYWGTDSSCPNLMGTNTSVTNGTYYQPDTDGNFSSNSQTYYWKVCVNDSEGEWTNETYHFTTIGANKGIISKGQNAYSLEINPGGTTLYGYINGNSVSTSIDSNWHYVTITYDNTDLKIYKDGEYIDSTNIGGDINTNNNNLLLGELLSGTLDELRVSNTARSAAWINTTYLNTNSPTTFATFGTQKGVLTAWSYRKQIWINASMIDNDLTNFPVLISTIDNDLKNNAHSSGNDIIFINSSVDWTTGSYTDRLAHEVEYYNSATGELIAWVNITSVSSTTNTSIYMYYGNSLCTANRQNPTGVWDSNYVAVWHLNGSYDGTSGEVLDSTSNSNDGTGGSGSDNPPTQTNGIVGYGQDFENTSNNDIEIPYNSSLDVDEGFTLSAWVNLESVDPGIYNQGPGIMVKDGDDQPYEFGIKYDSSEPYDWGANQEEANGADHQLYSSSDCIYLDTWYYLVYVDDGSTGKLIRNGSITDNSYDTSGWTTYQPGSGVLEIGNAENNNAEWMSDSYFDGIIDEVRISNVARNSSWINATYNTTSDPGNFTAFCGQEIKNVAPVISNPSPSNGATGQSLNPTLSITVGDANNDAMNVTFHTNATGTWGLIGYNDSVYNGTYSQTNSSMNSYSTTYWWSVNVTDDKLWTNATYNFTTAAAPSYHTYIVNYSNANKAYEGGDSDGGFNDGGELEFTAGDYGNIDGDDSNYVQDDEPTTSEYQYHRFNFTIDESVSDITQIDVTWKGVGGAKEPCFPADTRVETSTGNLTFLELYKAYQNQEALPKVFYIRAGNVYQGNIEKVTQHRYAGPLVILRLSNGKELKVTPDHPILVDVQRDEYIVSTDIAIGTELPSSEDEGFIVVDKDTVSFDGFVYNLEVEEYHNFLLTVGLFIHNTLPLDLYGHSLWVKESGSWTEKGSGTQTSKETLTAQYTSNFDTVISSGHMHVGAQSDYGSFGETWPSSLNSYYVEVNVTYTPS